MLKTCLFESDNDCFKSARNPWVIEVLGGVFVLSRCFSDFFCWCRAFVIRLSQILSFFSIFAFWDDFSVKLIVDNIRGSFKTLCYVRLPIRMSLIFVCIFFILSYIYMWNLEGIEQNMNRLRLWYFYATNWLATLLYSAAANGYATSNLLRVFNRIVLKDPGIRIEFKLQVRSVEDMPSAK